MTAEEIARRYGIGRGEQDAFAAESQARAAAAIAAGRFAEEIVPVAVKGKRGESSSFATDEYPRAGTTVDKLAGLKPAFAKEGGVTAGNASGINDGAAALVVASTDRAIELGRTPLARIVSYAVAGVEPMVMGLGPVPAVKAALAGAGLQTDDIDLFELNEAFAVQSLAVVRDLGLDPARVNVNGGAIALGHPIGASGARILTTLLHALAARDGQRGLASLCIGGGMGIALIVERLCRRAASLKDEAVDTCKFSRACSRTSSRTRRATRRTSAAGCSIGSSSRVQGVRPARNELDSRTRYRIDPKDHFAAIRDGRARGLDVVGAYHSHPHSPPLPSETDLSEAVGGGFLYLIAGLGPGTGAWEVRGYLLAERNFVEVPLVLVDEDPPT